MTVLDRKHTAYYTQTHISLIIPTISNFRHTLNFSPQSMCLCVLLSQSLGFNYRHDEVCVFKAICLIHRITSVPIKQKIYILHVLLQKLKLRLKLSGQTVLYYNVFKPCIVWYRGGWSTITEHLVFYVVILLFWNRIKWNDGSNKV